MKLFSAVFVILLLAVGVLNAENAVKCTAEVREQTKVACHKAYANQEPGAIRELVRSDMLFPITNGWARANIFGNHLVLDVHVT